MLSKAVKQELVKEFNEKFRTNPSLMVVEYKGLSVKQMQGLRNQLKNANADLRVVKNRLLQIASQDTEVEKIKDLFVGPTAVAICNDDPTSVAKVFVDSMKELSVLKLKGGIIDGQVVGFEEVSKLSRLPSKEVLLSQFVALLSNPLSNFLATLSEIQRHLIYVLNAVKELKESDSKEQD